MISGSLGGDGDDDINKAVEGQDILFHTTASDFRRPILAKNPAFSRRKRQQRYWSTGHWSLDCKLVFVYKQRFGARVQGEGKTGGFVRQPGSIESRPRSIGHDPSLSHHIRGTLSACPYPASLQEDADVCNQSSPQVFTSLKMSRSLMTDDSSLDPQATAQSSARRGTPKVQDTLLSSIWTGTIAIVSGPTNGVAAPEMMKNRKKTSILTSAND